MCRKAAAILPSPVLGRRAGDEGVNDHSPAPRPASQTWAMLIKRFYEMTRWNVLGVTARQK